MMIWSGYNPYLRFIRNLENSGKLGAATLQKQQPQEWRTAQATVYGTNRPDRASSTFVRNIRYLPQSRVTFVRLGNNEYWYNMTPRQLATWLTSNSLGRYYNKYIKLS